METIDIAGTYHAQWGEGPLWWQNHLYYVDIENARVLALDPANDTEKSWDVGTSVGRVGTVVPRAQGGLVVAGDTGIHFLDPDTGNTTSITDPEPEKPDNRFNDGKCSPDGRFFAGSISLVKNTGDASLYRLDPDLSLHTAFDKVTNSNGIAWSLDGATCYYIDTPRQEVIAFDYHPETGQLENARTAFSTRHINASPDGMTIDSTGNLWIAFCHGACVICYDPTTGKQRHRVELPCLETTACAFGGTNLDELYVTTGIHSTHEEDDAGRLLRIRGLGVTGVPAHPFAG
ncbi:MAG: SMP-30/gluconolactonase/LRE family protein [Verrucomicrobiae bacterium]|nr:SMP-30/gluconolactonase/LRE family protein [Verrucomicrobiae bacterium]NNJ44120.1 SMP-30/gluconolactonase/LRE family protein [Akkermansiaceae bacterium]